MVFKIIGELLDSRSEAKHARSLGYESFEGFYLGPCGFWRGYYDPARCSIEHGHDLNAKEEALDGYGTYYNAYTGKAYKGNWRSGTLSLDGLNFCKILRNQDLYEGRLKNGKPDGPGKIWYGYQDRAIPSLLWGGRDASYFEGYFENGVFHGRGSFQWPFGVSYSGDFVGGKREGTFVLKLPDNVEIELNFKHDVLQGHRVRSPNTHPLFSTRFKQGKRSRDSYHEHYYIGDPNGFCITLSVDGFVPTYFYMGEAQNGDGHGDGVRMYFSQNQCVLERGSFAKSALFGRGHDQCITHVGVWDHVPRSYIKNRVEEGDFFDGKLKDGGTVRDEFVRGEAEFQFVSV